MTIALFHYNTEIEINIFLTNTDPTIAVIAMGMKKGFYTVFSIILMKTGILKPLLIIFTPILTNLKK